jgi:PTS system glucitol/sorbitol-specific IIA component
VDRSVAGKVPLDPAPQNLLNLGHVDFKADGRTEAKLPGDVCVPSGSLATVRVGDVVRIVRADSSDTREENPV